MAILHVHDVPIDLYSGLKKLAESNHRSLSAEVIVLLKKAIGREQIDESQRQVISRINQIRAQTYPPLLGEPTSLDLLREDRAR